MSLKAGSRLGPYEVLAPLGVGGMGEVYRARDKRLSRSVALKVLPGEISADKSRLERFEKEARAASSLNHPNIVTIYDIGSSDSLAYIAMELVEGRTLREVLVSGPIALRRLLSLSAQIADGLAKAHSAGIVHRDLKPENLMVTKDGFVKILDFGLAKLVPSDFESSEGSDLATATRGTEPGTVLGTVGYMSPEQASGHPVDFRSDQFSLGAILYEMASGKPTFDRATAVQTLSAVIQDEPEPLSGAAPKTPANLVWIIERCLAKDPEDRYVSTKDLARDLAALRDHVSEVFGVVEPVSRASMPRRRVLVLLAAAALVAAGSVASKLLWSPSRPEVPRLHQLTFRRGVTGQARFTPDGQAIVYSAAWDGKPNELFSMRLDGPESRSLDLPSADILSISSKGEMAIRLPPDTLARVPLAGGAPRELLKGVESADWAPDGSGLSVIRRVGGTFRLEYPIGKVLVESTAVLRSLRFSPKGDRIAFMEGAHGAGESSVCFVELNGAKRVVSVVRGGADLVWAPAGDEIWVSDAEEHLHNASELLAIRLDGRSRPLARLPDAIRLYDVLPDGRALIEHVRFRGEIWGYPPEGPGEIPLSWLDASEAMGLSEDGRMLLINEWARGAVYLRATDGQPAMRLGEGSARALSADGKWALISRPSPPRLILLPTGLGRTREYPLGRIEIMWRAGNASFFPDARRAVILGHEPGEKSRSYVLDFASGAIVPITPPGTEGLWIAPDGASLLAKGDDGKFALYPIQPGAAPGRPVAGIDPEDEPIGWTGIGQSMFVVREERLVVSVFAVDTATGDRRSIRQFRPADPAGVLDGARVLVARDGRFWAVNYWRDLSDFYLVDGLK